MGSEVVDASPTIALAASILSISTLIALGLLGRKYNKLKTVHFQTVELRKQLNWLEPAIQILHSYHLQNRQTPDYVTWRNTYVADVTRFLGSSSWARHAMSGTLPLACSDRFPWYTCDQSTLKLIETAVRTGKMPQYTTH